MIDRYHINDVLIELAYYFDVTLDDQRLNDLTHIVGDALEEKQRADLERLRKIERRAMEIVEHYQMNEIVEKAGAAGLIEDLVEALDA